MKRILLTLLTMSLLFLGGCWDRTEINDLAIITGAAIDAADDKQIELSVQVFIPRALNAGRGSTTSGGNLTLVKSAKGASIADAIAALQTKIPRKIFWGHCEVFIFGEDMAKRGISEEMDFLVRHPQPRERAYMFVSKGRAAKTLELRPELERYSSEVIREMSDMHIGMLITIIQLKEMLRGKSNAAALPLIDVMPPQNEAKELETAPYIMGTAVFRKGKMVGEINEKATRGVMWIRGEVERYTVTVKLKNVQGTVSLNPIRSDIKFIPSIRNGQWQMTIKAKTEGDVVQNGTNLDMGNPEMIKLVEKAFQQDIEDRIELALKQVQHEMKADIFDFATDFYREYPQEWKAAKNNWDEIFPNVKVTTDIHAYVRRPGLVTLPGGIPEEEVREK
ncbi:spore gernimation protein GerC [Brevibacillus parabrevis]|uniref:Ger(x)C family spore germination protein n=1 Tax=Brevibacillus parabrevis TaxID=54914 RepID=UPI0007ABAA5F|nr:Ger(x)C family spore germination protein [Brevibacillus parabrevis]KZE45021.1 spore gernimation protein GerC [Brevibacillus parabrevis]